jgi:opacity protein-like surface antigen
MTRPRLTQLLCLVAGVCISSSPARAQGARVFAMGSGSFLLNQKFFTAVSEPFRSDYASGGKITLGGEVTPWKLFGVEAAYGYGTNNLRVTDLSTTPSSTQGYGVKAQRLSANLVLHSPAAVFGVRPYATAGLEYDRFSPTTQAKSAAFAQGFAAQGVTLGASNKIGINYGAGVEWSFIPKLALRLDFRDHVTGTPTYGLSSGRYNISGVAHDAERSAGLVLHIGK